MSLQDYTNRRVELARQISGQRRELSEAYRDLGKPLFYAQTGIKGFQMIRQNAWLIALAPTAIGAVFSMLGWKKEKSRPKLFGFWKRKSAPADEAKEAEAEISQRDRPLLRRLIGHGITAFKFYRRVRPYIPL